MATTINGVRYDTVGEMRCRVEELDAEYPGQLFPDDAREEWNELNEAIEEFNTRHDWLAEMAKNPHAREAGASFDVPGNIRSDHPAVREGRDGGLRTVERYTNSGAMRSEAADTMERLIRDPKDPLALGARYLEAVGDPHYNSAFGKILQHGTLAPLRFSKEEQTAVQKVNGVEAERGLITGVGSPGRFRAADRDRPVHHAHLKRRVEPGRAGGSGDHHEHDRVARRHLGRCDSVLRPRCP